MLKIKVKIFFSTDWNTTANENKYGYMNFNRFSVCGFYFHEEVPAEFVVACKTIPLIPAVLIKQLVEYLLKQARSIWLQGNCRGPYRLSFLLYPSRNSQRKTHFPQNWTWWFERRTAAWITKICIIQSMLNVLEKDIFSFPNSPVIFTTWYLVLTSSMKLENLSFLFIFWVLLYLTCVKWTRATVTFIADIFSLIIL